MSRHPRRPSVRSAGTLAALGLALWLGFEAGPAGAANAVPPLAATADADIAGTAARLVLAWPTKIDYTAHLSDTQLVLEFGRATTIDMAAALRRLRGFVDQADVSDGGRTVTLHFAKPLTAKSWYQGSSLVIAFEPAAAKPAAKSKPAEETKAPAATADALKATKAAKPAKTETPVAPLAAAAATGAGSRETARTDPIDLLVATPQPEASVASADGSAAEAPPAVAEDLALHALAREKAVEAAAAAKVAKAEQPADVPAPAEKAEKTEKSDKSGKVEPTVTLQGDSGPDYGRLVFDWKTAVTYTIRREDGDEFIVAFARPANIDVDAVNRTLPKHLRVVRAKVQNGATVVWLKVAKGAAVRDVREGNQVVLYLEKGKSSAGKTTAAAEKAAKPAPTTGPRVKLTSTEAKGYTRLLFDWPKKTTYRFKTDGDEAVITFAKPGRLDLAKLLRKLPRNIAALQAETADNGGLAVRITLAPGATIDDKREGRKVALKISDPKPVAAPVAEAVVAAKPEPEPAQPARTPPPERTAFAPPAPLEFLPLPEIEVPAPESETVAAVEITGPAPVRDDAGSAQRADAAAGDAAAEPPSPAVQSVVEAAAAPAPEPVAPVVAEPAAPVAAEPVTPAAVETPPAALEPVTAAPVTVEPATAEAVPATAEAPKVVAAPVVPVEPQDLTPVRISVDGDTATLRIALPKARTAAAFQRAGQTWVVFNSAVHLELSLVRRANHPAIGQVRQLPSEAASVLLFGGASAAAPRLSREGDDWVIEMREQAAQPNQAIAVAPAKDAPQLVLEVEHPGQTVTLSDPEVGDSLFVTPVETAGLGIAAGGNWPEFQLLPTIQGVAVAPLSDGVQVVSAPDSITIAGPDTHIVAHTDSSSPVAAVAPQAEPADAAPKSAAEPAEAAKDAEEAAPDAATSGPRRLFKLVAWRRGGDGMFLQDRQALQTALAAAAPAKLDDARLALARFYFANGMATETRGMLDLMTPEAAADPEIVLMRAAAALMLDDDRAAEPLLAQASLDGDPEAEIWRGVLAAHKGAWEAAATSLAKAGPLLGDYAKPVRTELRFLAAEARTQMGDPLLAGELMDQVRADHPTADDMAELGFLDGLRANRVGRLPEAKKQWEQVLDTENPRIKSRTLYELTLLQLKDQSITPDKAIERLEQARFLWRGGQLELAVTRQLAELYLQQGDARRGLTLLRGLAAQFADSPDAGAIAQRMGDAFANLYLKGGADKLKPLTAVALFQEFRELMPAGEKGDQMIAGLADRMVKVDLLDQAAALLDEQMRKRLQGVDKARVGARLAAIRLLDRKADTALDALKLSDGPDLPADLVAERRRLEARARVEKGQGDVAIGLIAGDTSPDASLLRVDIAWHAQKWADAATAIGELIAARKEDPAKLSAEGGQLVLNRAVALSLSGDHDGLKELRDQYTETMAAGPYADAFALLTSDFAEADALKPVAEQLKGVEQVEGFLATYRKRLQTASLSQTAAAAQ